MQITSRKSGFSLIELLTVIAIIAILAAIIFPVMNVVKLRAQENDCATKLHQIQLAVEMYKKDNRRYPPVLCAALFDGNNNPVPFENAQGDYLYPEHVKTVRMFHCPTSKVTSTTDIATYMPRPYEAYNPDQAVYVYAYDSYDCFVTGTPVNRVYPEANVEPHYIIDWAPDVAYLTSSSAPQPDPNAPGAPGLVAQQDYERQLKFRNPPGDTVVTWCSYHEGEKHTGRALVVFLDGYSSSYDAKKVAACKWRLREKKE